MRDYLLFCTYCSSYTLLHNFDKDSGTFHGEYSLLHNNYTHNNIVLNKFLLAHLGHSIQTIPSKTDEYRNIICTASHFLEDDIDKYVEESLAQVKYQERDRQNERAIGKVQIHIVEHLLTHELETLENTSSASSAEGQVLLGKELGLKRSLAVIRQVLSDKQFA